MNLGDIWKATGSLLLGPIEQVEKANHQGSKEYTASIIEEPQLAQSVPQSVSVPGRCHAPCQGREPCHWKLCQVETWDGGWAEARPPLRHSVVFLSFQRTWFSKKRSHIKLTYLAWTHDYLSCNMVFTIKAFASCGGHTLPLFRSTAIYNGYFPAYLDCSMELSI